MTKKLLSIITGIFLLGLIFFVVLKYLNPFFKNTVSFTITNNSEDMIENLSIRAGGECIKNNYKNKLALNEKIELFLDFSSKNKLCKNQKKEGAYTLSYEKDGEKYSQDFGYFTNGIPLDGEFIIEIKEKNIKVNNYELIQ